MKRYLPVILKGAISGWILYSVLVFIYQNSLEKKIANVETFNSLFQGDPALEGVLKINSLKGEFNNLKGCDNNNSRLTWRIARNLGVIEADVSEQNLDSITKSSLSKILCDEDIDKLQKKKGINLLLEFLRYSGGDHSNSFNDQIFESIVNNLASAPLSYRDLTKSLDNGNEFTNSWFRRFISHGAPPEVFSSVWKKNSEKELISLLYLHFEVGNEEFKNIDPLLTSKAQNYDQFNDMVLKLTLLISNHPDVIIAKERVMMFKGLIQLLIFMVFGIAIMLILFVSEETNKHKAFLNVLKTTLPTLGFIGTIIGLMKSLGQAYRIPLSTGGADTSIAISDITTALGLAFTTTLLAFVLLIIIDFISIIKLQKYWS